MMNHTAGAIRKVTGAIQNAIDAGERSTRVDANDLIDVLLAIADEIEPPFGDGRDRDHEPEGERDAGR